jgi:hypothetical protein
MRREDSDLEMPRRFPMELMRWSLVKVMDECSWEKRNSVLKGSLFLCLCHGRLSMGSVFSPKVWLLRKAILGVRTSLKMVAGEP